MNGRTTRIKIGDRVSRVTYKLDGGIDRWYGFGTVVSVKDGNRSGHPEKTQLLQVRWDVSQSIGRCEAHQVEVLEREVKA